MNSQRKKSKSRRSFPHSLTSREQSRKRMAADKRNAKRRRRKLENAKPKATPDLMAERAAKAKEACLKVFRRFLEKPEVTELAGGDGSALVRWVGSVLDDVRAEIRNERDARK